MVDVVKVAKALLAASVFLQQTGMSGALAQGLPTGGSVSSGAASIATSGTAMTVTQTTPNAIVNWNSFSIGQPNSVTFNQPGPASAILNRVTGNTPSTIAGQLNANGQVFLINPNGIAITPTGTVNVGGGFVASTLGISDEDFKRGQHRFMGNGASAGVANEGAVTIGRGGYAALIGGTVTNAGRISVPLGKVGLASGEQVTLDVAGDGFLQVAVPTKSASGKALIEQAGKVSAPGGRVVIEAATARDAARNAVNLGGVTEARTIGGRTGAIVIGGGEGGAVSVSGTVDAGGGRTGGGGQIALTGREVALKGARVNASGATGGGSVAIGGGQRGSGPLPHAEKVTIDAATRIDVDARQSGAGGNVVVWSDKATGFAGLITSRGGRSGGDAGQVEVSSKGHLAFDGMVVLTAASGRMGTLLLDPRDLYIANAAGAAAAPAGWSVIDTGVLQTQLALGNVVLETGSGEGGLGNIAVAAGSVLSWTSTSQLTLQADNSITLEGTITAPGGRLSLQAQGSITDTAATSISAAGIDAAAAYVSLAGSWRANGGEFTIRGQEAVLVSATASLSSDAARGGAVSLVSDGGFVLVSGQVRARGLAGPGGTVSINGAVATTLLGGSIDASGTSGGGSIGLGGIKGAPSGTQDLTVDSTSTLTADATLIGHGGGVSLWSQGSASFHGRSSARGGADGGTGGAIEVSAANGLVMSQGIVGSFDVSARAPGFANGAIAIDPATIVIGDAMTSFDIFRALLTGSGNAAVTTQPITGLASNSGFGTSAVLNGTYALIGAIGVSSARGNAYLYNLSTGAWTDLATTSGQPITGLGSASLFGWSAALNSTYALIGSAGVSSLRGNAYLYNLSTGAWTDLAMTSDQPVTGLAPDSFFGTSAALNSTYALIGAQGVSSNRGNAYLYNLSTGAWTDLATTSGQPVTGLASNSQFGASAALNGTYVLIGATGVSSARGTGYLYNLSTGAWTDLAMTSGQPVTGLAPDSLFGTSAALNGNYALLGARGASSNRGTGYLYNLSTGAWTNLATTSGQPVTGLAPDSGFGTSVALNSTHALIGAAGVSNARGNAYLYNLSTGAWTDLAMTSDEPVTGLAVGSQFGRSAALNSTYALIGAAGVSSARGNAYLYNLSTEAWANLGAGGQPITGLASNSVFGNSAALSGTYALIGATGALSGRGNAYLYNLSTGVWTDLSTTSGQPVTGLATGSQFGTSTALYGTHALIGAPGVSSARGNAYLYNLSTGAWTDLATTSDEPVTGLAPGSQFGTSAALYGTHALIGAPGVSGNRGNAYLYNLSTGAWTDLATTLDQPITSLSSGSRFGISAAFNGTHALIGAPGVSSARGNAYLYNLPMEAWKDLATTLGQPITDLAPNSLFGTSVALDGTYALIGAPGVLSSSGNAYLYNLWTGAWTDLATTGQPITGLASNSRFGTSAALNGTYALIGATGVLSNRGNAYLYNLSTGAWTGLAATVDQPITGLASNSFFGTSAALNGTHALIGATGVSSFRGNAYLYNLSTGAWTDLATASGPPVTGLTSNSFFGTSAALNDTHALIGATGVVSFRGNGYLYDLSTGAWTDLSTTPGQPITGLASLSQFGTSAALNSTHALIGATGVSGVRGNAYLYNLSTGAWTDLSTTSGQPVTGLASSSQFGTSAALNSTHALIGAMGVSSNRGNAYLYNLSTGAWTDLAMTSGQPVTGLAPDSRFGQSAALNGTYALIGAVGVSSNRGNAYLYNLSTEAWTDLAMTSGQPVTGLAPDSLFGNSVALNSTHGLIGAAGVSSNRGNGYLYNLSAGAWADLAMTSGQPVTDLSPGSGFGTSAALNGTHALIGAMGVSSLRGNGYLYNLSTGAWTDLATTSGQPITGLAPNSIFGASAALNGTHALIGAYGASSFRGNAYLYNLSTGAWTDLATTLGQSTIGLASNSQFGTSAALNGTYALIGAPGVSSNRGNGYLYNLSTGAWTDLATTSGQPVTSLAAASRFGNSAALNDTHALIGAQGASSNRGNAYLYNLSTGAWTDLATTSGQPVTGLAAASRFGNSAALNDTHALIGARGASSNRGNAYLYNLSTGAWTDLATTPGQPVTGLAPDSLFGTSAALNGNYALLGARGASSNRGNAYLYNLSTGAWTNLAMTSGQPVTNLGPGSWFGTSAALNDTYALIGAIGVSGDRGNAYLYNLSTGAWADLSMTSGQPVTGLATGSQFGTSAALNGTYALIGAAGVSSFRGNAYLYNLSTGAWTDLATTSGQPVTGLASNSQFGSSAALNSTYALIGATGVSSSQGNAWLVYLPALVDSNGPITLITPESIAASLQTGSLTLTADNSLRITAPLVLSPIVIANSLTLRSGGSILVDAPIAFGGRTVNLEANAPNAQLGASANRLAGAAGIAVASGAPIDNVGGQLSFIIGTQAASGRDATFGATGVLSIAAAVNAGTVIESAPDAAIVNSAAIGATTPLTLAGIEASIFISGASVDLTGATLSAGASRWLVFNSLATSAGPSAVTLDGNTASFTRFSCSLGSACGNGAVVPGAGNGLLYAWAPVLTVSGVGAASKVYDATIAAAISGTAALGGVPSAGTLTSDVTGVTLVTTAAAATFDDKNVGSGKAVGFSGYGLSNDTLGYILVQPTSTTATITAASLTAGLTGTVSKVYDSTVAAILAPGNYTLGTILGSDVVTVSGTGVYDNKNVGTGKTVTVTGLALSGTDAGNYVLTSTTAAGNVGTITAASLTAGLTGTVGKVYDTTVAATLAAGNYTLGVLGSDSVTVSGTGAAYDNKNVGTAKTVTATGLVLSGSDAGNYVLTSITAAGNVGTITAASLTAGLTGTVGKVYDSTVAATLAPGNYTLGTILGSDSVTVSGTGAYDNKNVGTGKAVMVTGLALSGMDAGNYVLTSTTASATMGTITAASLTAGLTGTVSKVYDTTVAATLAAGNYALGILGSDSVTVSGTGAAYDNKNVGTAKTVTATGLVLSGSDAGNYVLTSTTAAGNVGTITTASLTAGLTGTVSKVYDSTVAAILAAGNYTLGTILGSDSVTVSGTGAYDNKNVGSGKTVTATGLVLSGSDAGNYVLTSTTASATMGTITVASLTAGLTGTVGKVYDTTVAATLAAGNYTLGILGSDSVTVSGTGVYDNKNVGTGKTVTVTGLALSGSDAGNYVLTSTTAAGNVGTITAASLTAGLTGTVGKVYDSTVAATLAAGNYTLGTILGSDSVTVSGTGAAYDNKNVGTGKTVTANGLALSGTDAGNYVLTSITAAGNVGTITAASLTAGLTGTVGKVYDSTVAATLAAGNYTLGTILGSDSVTVSGTGAYDNKNVGSGKTVTATGLTLSGTDAGNYVLTSTTASATMGTITVASLTAGLTGTVSKVYDTTVAATLAAGNYALGILGSDSVTVSGTGVYDNKNVGTGKTVTVTGLVLSGTDAGNYVLTSTIAAGNVGTITAASLTAGLTGTVSKVYDSTVAATLAAGNYTLGTILGSDSVTVSGTGAYDNKNVGSGKTVTATGLVLSGSDAGNYVLTSTTASATMGTITVASLTAGLTGTVGKVYDTTVAATLAAGNYALGILGSDSVTVSGTGVYDNKNVGTGKTVTVTGLALSGTDAGNYVLTSTTAAGNVGTITAASLTAGLTGTVGKVYDTTVAATLAAGNYTLGTILGSDVVTVSGTGAYDNKNVGTAKTVTATGLVLSGSDAGNYVLTSITAAGNVGTITAASLTAGLTGTVGKVYDSTVAATLAPGNYTLGTILGSDSVTVSGTGAYDNKNVGTGKAVMVTGLALSGMDAGNYVLTSTTASATMGTITAASLTAGLTGTVSKVYDTTVAATLAAGNYALGILGSDSVTVSGTGAAYDNKNVGTAKTVTATGLVLSGSDAGNYVLTSTTANGAVGTVTPATLTYTATAVTRDFGTANPAFSGSVTGLVGMETLASATMGAATFGSPATISSRPGYYAIDGSGLIAIDGNYIFAQAPGNATALTVTAMGQVLAQAATTANVGIAIVDTILSFYLDPAAHWSPKFAPGAGDDQNLTPGYDKAVLCLDRGCTAAIVIP